MTVLLIAACYWPKANNWGAIAAIISGSSIPIAFLVLQEIESTQAFANRIGPYKSAIAAYFLTGLAMVAGSYLKHFKV